jgi:hypothetical protein
VDQPGPDRRPAIGRSSRSTIALIRGRSHQIKSDILARKVMALAPENIERLPADQAGLSETALAGNSASTFGRSSAVDPGSDGGNSVLCG